MMVASDALQCDFFYAVIGHGTCTKCVTVAHHVPRVRDQKPSVRKKNETPDQKQPKSRIKRLSVVFGSVHTRDGKTRRIMKD